MNFLIIQYSCVFVRRDDDGDEDNNDDANNKQNVA